MSNGYWQVITDINKLKYLTTCVWWFSVNKDGTINPVTNEKSFHYNGEWYMIKRYYDTDTEVWVYYLAQLIIEKSADVKGYDEAVKTGKMMVHIKPDADNYLIQSPEDYIKTVSKIAGTWVEVDTKFLFSSSFNVKLPGKKSVLFAISSALVDAIVNDARKNRKRCNRCGEHSLYRDVKGRLHLQCPKCKSVSNFSVFGD